MKLKSIYITLLLTMITYWVHSQELAYAGNPDSSFFNARDLAFEGNRSDARDTLQHILSKYPEYVDVQNLLAKTYSWDGAYDEARKHFNTITSKEKENKEVWVAAINNELYARNYATALGLTNKALIYLKNDTDLDILKTKALNNINSTDGDTILEKKADDKEIIETKVFKNRIGIANVLDVFDVVYDPMVYSSLEYKRETRLGSIIPRINYSNRFETNGLQYETDFYPKLSKIFYGYLNYGFSNSPIYPNHRAGAELYAKLPNSMEASLGMRYLDLESSTATILTSSIGLYNGNYYFSLRPYITPRTDGPTSFSGSLMARKYLRNSENYLGLNLVIGYAPELKQLISNDVLLAETLLFIESQQLLLEYQFTGKGRPNIYKANLGVTRQELIFDAGEFFLAVSAGLTYQVKF